MKYMEEVPTPTNTAQVPSDPQSAIQETPLQPEVAQEELVPETVDETVQIPPVPPPQDPPPVLMQSKKPPVILVAASLGIITLFVIGLLIISLGKKNTSSNSPQPTQFASVVSPSKKPAKNKSGLSTRYLSPDKDYTFSYPPGYEPVFDTKEPFIGFCGIGAAEMSVTFTDKTQQENQLIVSVAKKKLKGTTPESWVKENCTPLLEDRVSLGLIKEGNVEGASYTIPFTEGEFGALAYNLTIIKKEKLLYFIYASGSSDEVMKSVFDPLLTSFTLNP